MTVIFCIVLSYLLGSISFGLFIGKVFFKKDIRRFGSGNLGATNAFRVLGLKAGIVVTISDILKGTIPTYLAIYLDLSIHPIFIGLFAVIGHMYPIFANFQGGKAVATSAGVILAVAPLLFVLIIAIFLLILYLSKYVSLSSMLSAVIATILSFVLYKDYILLISLSLLAIFIIYRHIENIKRIINRTEPKITWM